MSGAQQRRAADGPWLILLVVSLAISAMALEGNPATAQPRTEFTVAIDADARNLDPTQAPAVAPDRLVRHNLYGGLMAFKGGTTDVMTDLAESYTVSADQRVYTFRLRRGVQFHKGYGELTSADVRFTIERHRDPAARSPERQMFEQVERVETPDPYSVRIYLRQPAPAFLNTLAWQSGFIISEKAFKELDQNYAFTPIGTGPYVLDSWAAGQQLVLASNEKYYLGAPAVKRVVLRVIPEEIISVNALLKGEIDAVSIQQLGAYRAIRRLPSRIRVVEGPGGRQFFAYLQTKKAPTSDAGIRTGIKHALDLEVMERALGGIVASNPSLLSPLNFGYTESLPIAQYDPETARRIFKTGLPPLRIIYFKSFFFEEYALMIKDQLSKVTAAEVEQIDRAVYSRKLAEGDWHIALEAITRLEADHYLSAFVHSAGANNHPRYASGEADRMIEEARTATDARRRRDLHVRLQRLVARDLPIVTLGTQRTTIATSLHVEGLEPHPYPALLAFYPVRLR